MGGSSRLPDLNTYTTTKLQFIDGVENATMYPETFEIPSDREKAELIIPGAYVKVGVIINNGVSCERTWIEVTEVRGDQITGRWGNTPEFFNARLGDPVVVEPRHVLAIWSKAPATITEVSKPAVEGVSFPLYEPTVPEPEPEPKPEPRPFQGEGGTFGGAGASGSWDAPTVDTPLEPAVGSCTADSSSSDSSSSDSSSSDSSSSNDQ